MQNTNNFPTLSGCDAIVPANASRSPDEVMARLAERYPRVFPIWKQLFDRAAVEYAATPIHSISIDGHAVAKRFGSFIVEHAEGRLLDIGCGPQAMPLYLEEY